MVVLGIAAQQERRQAAVVVDRVGIIEKSGEPAAHRLHPAAREPFHRPRQHRADRVVLAGGRLEVD